MREKSTYAILGIGSLLGDSSKRKTQKQILVGVAVLMSVGGMLWGTICLYYNLYFLSLIPYGYVVFSAINLLFLYKTKRFKIVRFLQVLMSLLLPFIFQWFLGGFISSGAVMLWALLSLAASVTYQKVRDSVMWLVAYLVLLIFSGVTNNYFSSNGIHVTEGISTVLFVINITLISILVLVLILYFVSSRDKANEQLKEFNESLGRTVKERTVQMEKQNIHMEEAFEEVAKMYDDLDLLSRIGQKIIVKLDVKGIITTAYEELNKVMDASGVYIGLYEKEKKQLEFFGSIVNGGTLADFAMPVDINSTFPPIECFVHQKEIKISGFSDSYSDEAKKSYKDYYNELAKLRLTKVEDSKLFTPLSSSSESIGIISIQSFKKNAYSEYDFSVLKNVAVYVTIALENAKSYKKIKRQKESISNTSKKIQNQKEELEMTLDNLKNAQSQLVQSEKMASLGQLIAGIAHEINTPLGAVKASIGSIIVASEKTFEFLPEIVKRLPENLLTLMFNMINSGENKSHFLTSREERKIKRDLQLELSDAGFEENRKIADRLLDIGVMGNIGSYIPLLKHEHSELILNAAYNISEQKWNSKNIEIAVERASKIVFALRNFARKDSYDEKSKADLYTGINSVLTLHENQLKHGVEVIKEYKEIPEIYCYPDDLNQVWTNLIYNGVQAMDYSGRLKIFVHEKTVDNTPFIVVGISDSGGGIPDEIKDKIFNPFFTTKPIGEGSGLGLDIVNNIIKKHDGHIEVDSEIGKGTTFSVYLPVIIGEELKSV